VPTMIRAYRMLAAEVPVPVSPRRDRGRYRVRRGHQERGRDRVAPGRRDRRHDARVAHCRPGEGGRGRLGDPQGARAPGARAGDDRVPLVRPRQSSESRASRVSWRAVYARTRRRSRSRSWGVR
jgi:hypothetical protein